MYEPEMQLSPQGLELGQLQYLQQLGGEYVVGVRDGLGERVRVTVAVLVAVRVGVRVVVLVTVGVPVAVRVGVGLLVFVVVGVSVARVVFVGVGSGCRPSVTKGRYRVGGAGAPVAGKPARSPTATTATTARNILRRIGRSFRAIAPRPL